jgi:eukaryotic-like serine/threonine-protein kinase
MNAKWSMRGLRQALSALSPFLLVVAAGGCSAPVASTASVHFVRYQSIGTPRTEPQSGSVISEGIDRHLKTILISDIVDDPTNNEESAEVYPALQRIGRQEGFTIKVVEASPSVWIRDDFLALSDGALLAPSQNPHVQQALEDLEAYRDPPGHVYAVDQGRVGRNHEIAVYESHARENGLVIRNSRVYLEGGNVMVAPKADGAMGVLIGMSSLLVSTFLLSREGAFARGASFPSELRATKLIIASELGVNPSQVIYLDQPEFHLDTFLTPGVNGQVFISDPDYSNAMIKAILRDPGLSRGQRDALKEKLYAAPSLSTLRAQLKPAIDELRAAGYRVIGIPGEYSPNPVEDTNFMNGIVATGRDGRRYDIVGMSPTTPLNGAFRKVMGRYGITVFFVPDTQGLIRQRGIIHCVTNEQIETTQQTAPAATAGADTSAMVYVGSFDRSLYAVDARTGAEIWSFPTGGSVFSSPSASDGLVYVGSGDGNIYALNARTGAKAWSFLTGSAVVSSPAVAGGTVYIASQDGDVYALDARTGAMIWKFPTGGSIESSPTVTDNVVYVGSDDRNVYALNARTGTMIWKSPTRFLVQSSPTVADNVVYAGSDDHDVYALNARTGAEIWKFPTGDDVFSSPTVAGNVVYVGSVDGSVYALNARTGAEIWNFATQDEVFSSPTVANGVLYVGSNDSSLYALNARTGGEIWSFTAEDEVPSSPTVANGVVYFGSRDDNLYALNARTGAEIWKFLAGGTVESSPALGTSAGFSR